MSSVECTVEDAMRAAWTVRDRLPMFVLYNHPADLPDAYVARLWTSLPHPAPTMVHLASPELENLRQIMTDHGFVLFPRGESDDPVIIESWMI